MYPDLDQSEVVFVHKLASGEPTARSRALKKLHAFIKERSQNKTLMNAETFKRLSKGLHYAMWMQDKPLLQQELAENIASLMDDMITHEEGALFVTVFFEALSSEWHLVDRWRMDKFLMMVRYLVRKVFTIMGFNDWSKEVIEAYLTPLTGTIINGQSKMVQSLKTHFASVYLDELCKSEKLTEDIAQLFINPYLDVLQENRATDFYFKSICDEIFQTLVYTASHELRKADHDGNEEDEKADNLIRLLRVDNPIPIDFKKLGKRLFKIGAQPTVNAKRRERLYSLSQKFKSIVQGKSALPKPMKVSHKSAVSRAKIYKAAEKLLEMEMKLQTNREKFKTEMKEIRKKENAEKLSNILASAVTEKKVPKKLKSSNKFKPNAIKKKVFKKSAHHVSKGKASSKSTKKRL